MTCESCYSEGGGVLVKLADLGISALVGPSGFQRRSSTPTYAAPEVIKYSGKEPLTEKVSKNFTRNVQYSLWSVIALLVVT